MKTSNGFIRSTKRYILDDESTSDENSSRYRGRPTRRLNLGFGINFEKNQEKLIIEKRKNTSPKSEEVSEKGQPSGNKSNAEEEKNRIEETQEKRLITCK